MKIEFYHDVICSFCYPMSYRFRKIADELDIDVVHRSYALARKPEDLISMFGDHAKEEIVGHWEHANQNDELHRFQIDKMLKSDITFPYSTPGLLAAKAAGVIAGETGYWDMFDAIQTALFTNALDVANNEVLYEIAKAQSFDFDEWKKAYEDPNTESLLNKDYELANIYDIRSVPCLIIDGKYRIDGAQPYEVIKDALVSLKKKEIETIASGASCHMEDGNIKCD